MTAAAGCKKKKGRKKHLKCLDNITKSDTHAQTLNGAARKAN